MQIKCVLAYLTLVGWASRPSGADKMSTPQENLLQHFKLANATKVRVDTTNVQGDATKVRVNTTNVQVDATKVRVDTTNVQGDATKVQVDTTNVQGDALKVQIKRLVYTP
ncbi:hypothetical protein CDG77_04605 [Nostoc sp. 'Peltigera membranacea cyanobiont' 213]|uniref:hypothetical protein n=2 Tax=Nostoc TaxID=1177 RepID=UPI000B95332D|nr:hypothetical protein [Nostoc sp. 'Peltigera membranacea cyanobiont' N6]AVH67772.1 hypothetical protein NPM_6386 [Nostoc sp. 'Peltigera membranacea cyanobiont' N6]OYD98743.1 hypothetical protein CDG77_04605 [Nostoc sp. 'Peltigera membranacea cyanobiont' 213]